MKFGVGKLIAYVYTDFFVKEEVKELPPIISFPCFKDEIMWIDMTELDILYND